MQQQYFLIGAVVAGLVLLALAGWFLFRRHRTRELTKRFGSEYEHTVAELGKRTEAEKQLEARAKRVEKLNIHPLPAGERDRFLELWRKAQGQFVDNPLTAVAEADRLVMQVMQARGYPMTDFEQRAADISVDHGPLVENYRSAHATAVNAEGGTASTEDLRQAMVHYRDMFEDLLQVSEREPEPVAG
jgi:hypothetical protein